MSDGAEPTSHPGPLILVIEDDVQIRRFLRTTLTSNGYRLLEATTAGEGLKQAGLHHPDVILLDLGLPDLDGLDVTRRLREWALTPIIVVSAREQERDKVSALDAGADDYLTKPFGTSELLARIRVALRHALRAMQGDEEPVFAVGGLQVDLVHRQVSVDGTEVHLTPMEYKLLTTLVRYAGKVVTRHQLLREVWGPTYAGEDHYLRVYMYAFRGVEKGYLNGVAHGVITVASGTRGRAAALALAAESTQVVTAARRVATPDAKESRHAFKK